MIRRITPRQTTRFQPYNNLRRSQSIMAQAGAGPSDSGSGYNIIRGTDDEANFMGMSLLPPRSTVVRRTTAAGAKRDFYTEEDDGYYDNDEGEVITRFKFYFILLFIITICCSVCLSLSLSLSLRRQRLKRSSLPPRFRRPAGPVVWLIHLPHKPHAPNHNSRRWRRQRIRGRSGESFS